MRTRVPKKGFGWVAGMAGLALVLLVAGAGDAQTKRKLSMGTGTIGGLYYIFGGALAKALNEAVPEVEITAESTPGSVANAQMIQAGKMAIGFSQATAAYESYNGVGWTKGTRHDKIRALVALYPAALTVYTLESRNIHTLKDLNGKDVSLGPAGAGVDQFGRNLFEVLGIKPKRIHNLPHEQTAKAVGDGQLDAGMTVQLAPWPGLKDLETSVNKVPCDSVIIATPIDLNRIIKIRKPNTRVYYDLQEIGKPDMNDILIDFLRGRKIKIKK